MPQGADGRVRGALSTGIVAGPADRRARQPVPGEHQHQAAGARGAPVHRQTRDTARARFLRQPVRVLPGRQRVSAHRPGRQRQAQAQRKVSAGIERKNTRLGWVKMGFYGFAWV